MAMVRRNPKSLKRVGVFHQKSLKMKHVMLFLVFFCLSGILHARYPMECSGSCPENCSSWHIEYEVDNDCRIIRYNAAHYYPNGDIIYSNHVSAPGFVGMSATALGCKCTVAWNNWY